MRIQFHKAALSLAVGALCATAALAQAPGPAPGMGAPGGPGAPTPAPATGSSAVANPNYVTMHFESAVINRPAEEVWKRIGKYCDIGEWMRAPCTILSGKDGELGAVRSIGREILVGKTDLSYTYTQPVAAGRPYNLYHGTMEVKPLTATTSKVVYNLMWDNSMLADDAAREREKARYTQLFEPALVNMKILAEGGTLPPAPARGMGGPGGPGAPGAGAPRGGTGTPGAPAAPGGA
jgi:hypothetical protein